MKNYTINDLYNRIRLNIHLLFTKNEKERRDILIAIALHSKEGRNLLFKAMIRELNNEPITL